MKTINHGGHGEHGGKFMLLEEELTGQIRAAMIEVHRHLGPGLLESVYEHALCLELTMRGLRFTRQVEVPVTYKGQTLPCGFRADLIVENKVIIELKSCDQLHTIHEAQLLNYLKLTGLRVGLLVNFNVGKLIDGIKRLVN